MLARPSSSLRSIPRMIYSDRFSRTKRLFSIKSAKNAQIATIAGKVALRTEKRAHLPPSVISKIWCPKSKILSLKSNVSPPPTTTVYRWIRKHRFFCRLRRSHPSLISSSALIRLSKLSVQTSWINRTTMACRILQASTSKAFLTSSSRSIRISALISKSTSRCSILRSSRRSIRRVQVNLLVPRLISRESKPCSKWTIISLRCSSTISRSIRWWRRLSSCKTACKATLRTSMIPARLDSVQVVRSVVAVIVPTPDQSLDHLLSLLKQSFPR